MFFKNPLEKRIPSNTLEIMIPDLFPLYLLCDKMAQYEAKRTSSYIPPDLKPEIIAHINKMNSKLPFRIRHDMEE